MYNDPHNINTRAHNFPNYPTPGQFVYPPSPPPKPYRNAILFVLLTALVVAFLCIGIGTSTLLSDLGTSLFMGTTVSIFVLDWRGLRTLDGLIVWPLVRGKRRGLLICAFIFAFPVMVSIYLVHKLLASFHPVVQPGPTRKPHIAMIAGGMVTLFMLLFSMVGNAAGTTVTTPTKTAMVKTTTTQSVLPKTKALASATPPTRTATPTPRPTQVVTLTPVPPTPKPRVVPVVQPTQPPAPKPTQPPQLFLSFTGASATDYAYGSVSVHTLSGAALSITVTYCSGYPATSGSLKGTSWADARGNHTWSWEPETKCKGAATATVTASLNGQAVSSTDNFVVQ